MGLGDFRFGTGALGGQAEGQSFNHPYQRLGFYGALGLGLGDFRFGTGALGGQAEGQSFNHPYQRLGFYGALGLGLGDFRYQRLGFYGPLGLGLGDFRFGTGALGGQAASITCQQMSHCCCLPRNVTLQRTSPCTSHPEPRSNTTRMLQSPATKCHTAAPATHRRNVPFPAPATQSHAPTLPDACHQMSHWCCASHATSHCNVPRAAPTLPGCFNHLPPNVTLVLRLPRNVNHLPPHVTLLLRLPRNVTLQRTIPCTSHAEPRSNTTRMLQSPATKCHTAPAPATHRHTATYHSLHQPPRATLQRYQMLQSPATKGHTGAAPPTQRHTATYPEPLQRYQDASITCH